MTDMDRINQLKADSKRLRQQTRDLLNKIEVQLDQLELFVREAKHETHQKLLQRQA